MTDLNSLEQEGEDKAKQMAKKEADEKLGTDNNQQGQNQQDNQPNAH